MDNSCASLSAAQQRPSAVLAALRGRVDRVAVAVEHSASREIFDLLVWIVVGTGLFGAALGSWRSPLQGLYGAIKLPLTLILTACGNAMINGMFAKLLGLDFSFRASLRSVAISFALAAAVLGAIAPVVAFAIWNTPPRGQLNSGAIHNALLIVIFALIAFAGIVANLRLVRLAEHFGTPGTARALVLAWLAVNLLLGSQFAWFLRPFIGAPELPVQFFRPNAFQGSFCETLVQAAPSLWR